MGKPVIDVGEPIQQSGLPGWLKKIFSWLHGLVIRTGTVDIQLDEHPDPLRGSKFDEVPHDPGPDPRRHL